MPTSSFSLHYSSSNWTIPAQTLRSLALSVSLWVLLLVFFSAGYTSLHAESWLRETFRACPANTSASASLLPSNTNAVTIDEENGMIRIVNNATGKPIVTVFRIYLGKGGIEYFAHQRIVGNGNECTFRSRTRFYTLIDEKWTEVTGQVLPKLKLSDFYGKRGPKLPFETEGVLSLTKEHYEAGDGMSIHYGLPNFGSRIFTRLLPQCAEGKKENLPEYDKIFEAAEFSLIELVWNKEESKFEIDIKK
jgi:hypothetical protein